MGSSASMDSFLDSLLDGFPNSLVEGFSDVVRLVPLRA